MRPPLPRYGDRRHIRVGLLGGSFNPAHEGHLHISQKALHALNLREVWWLVSPQNPLKSKVGMAPFADRLAAAEKLTAGYGAIRVTDLESRMGTRYTVETIEALHRRFPKTDFVWLMGADNLVQLPRWWRWKKILATVSIAVMDRSPYAFQALAGQAAQRYARRRVMARVLTKRKPPAWSFLFLRRHGASATDIRNNSQTYGDDHT